MRFEDTIEELFASFPALRSKYEDEGDYINGLSHLCYEIVFVPFIRQAVFDGNENLIASICDYFERMAGSDNEDERVSELLAVSVLEPILSERELVRILKEHMGNLTLNLFTYMEKETGWG